MHGQPRKRGRPRLSQVPSKPTTPASQIPISERPPTRSAKVLSPARTPASLKKKALTKGVAQRDRVKGAASQRSARLQTRSAEREALAVQAETPQPPGVNEKGTVHSGAQSKAETGNKSVRKKVPESVPETVPETLPETLPETVPDIAQKLLEAVSGGPGDGAELCEDDDDEVAEEDKTEADEKRGGRERKKKTSMKMADLEIVSEQEMREAMAVAPEKHLKERAALLESYTACFPRWRLQMQCGFNLLFHGLGSKRQLLEQFAATLTDGAAVAINGFLPAVPLKQVLQTLVEVVWDHAKSSAKEKPPGASATVDDLLGVLARPMDACHLYIVVHNIDGPGMRSAESQRIMAALAACESVHLAASIDNVSAPLMWDKQAAAAFNWWWLHAPTFSRYSAETAFSPPLLAARGNEKIARSAAVVLRSLTPNARGVFQILADCQLAHPDESGLPFHRWYSLCREKFLVSSELTLRTHLTEFRDHELVRTRRGGDGQDCLHIPLANDALAQLLKDMGTT